MNDIILSALLNLLALFGVRNGLDKDETFALVRRYLSRFFSVNNTGSYERLYSDLRDYYEYFPELEKDVILEGVCSNLHRKISPSDKAVTLLRFMEFCKRGGAQVEVDDEFFTKVASEFEIPDNVYGDLVAFTNNAASGEVKLMHSDDGSVLKTLYLRDFSIILFSYSGSAPAWMNGVQIEDGIFQVWDPSSILKLGRDRRPVYYSSVLAQYVAGNTADKVEMRGEDINFRFSNGPGGMHNFSFSLKNGEMVAIMGGSGVGKTTLLSLLNGNLKPQSGSITINGHALDEPEAKALIGFVPQDDLLIEELTVYQNLWYTAKLCFDSMPDEQIDARVMSTLTQLGLDSAKDLKVGSPINKYISGGQRKRLNIALELIREPAILFLDEPTSGLSSSDTENVVALLKEQTYKGKLIVVNIHQPSSDVYKMFDRLWLLDRGGYPVYDGSPVEAVSYFKKAANFADYDTSACPQCGNVYPELPLNIISERRIDSTGQLTEERKVSPQEWHEMYLQERPALPELSVRPIPHTDQKRPGVLRQVGIFLKRNLSAKLTNLQYMLVTLLEAPVLALICAKLTHFVPDSGVYTLMDNKNFPTYIFMAIIVAIFLGMSGSAEEIIKDRALLKREKFLRLSYPAYICSKVLYMAAVCLVQTALFLLVGNLIIGVKGMFLIWWVVLFVSAFLSSLIGLLLSQCLGSVVAIYISIPLLLIPQILLCGLVVDFEDLNPNSDTGNVPVIGDVIPSRWAYEALSVASFTMTEYARDRYDYDSRRFEALYYERSFVYELESRIETRKDEEIHSKPENPHHIAVLKAELPHLASVCGMEPYEGDYSYTSLQDYLHEAKTVLSRRSNLTTLELDRKVNEYIHEHGKESYLNLKKRDFNLQLENLVVNSKTEHVYAVVGDHIVPRSGYIYLTPRSHNGRAPFYSGVKILGERRIPTLWFNLGVLALMCVLLAVCLFTDCPGKFVRKERS